MRCDAGEGWGQKNVRTVVYAFHRNRARLINSRSNENQFKDTLPRYTRTSLLKLFTYIQIISFKLLLLKEVLSIRTPQRKFESIDCHSPLN